MVTDLFIFKNKNVKVEIISIGDELLIGQTIDTNSAWMGKKLYEVGARLSLISSISDNREQILSVLSAAEKRSDIVLITGGLGPTNDDITKDCLCEYFETELVMNQEVLRKTEDYFLKRGLKILESNRQQAALPKSCTILPNNVGTASGMWFERNDKVIISMPGVPSEMKDIMKHEVLPRLKKRISNSAIVHRTILTEGIGESFLAHKIEDWENSLAEENLKIAYLPSYGLVKIRLSAYGDNEAPLNEKIDRKIKELSNLIPNYFLGEGDDKLQNSIGKLLRGKGQTIATAESCTGGYLAHLITSVPQSSNYYKGSVISYDNNVKIDQLHVKREEIEKYGAVSQSVVEQMAVGVQKLLKVDYALATSGVAGPDGGTADKPVGTVWIALAYKDEVFSQKYTFNKDRLINIKLSANTALSMLRRHLLKEHK